jgi:hypothetical protein
MSDASICGFCNVERKPIRMTAVARGYELRVLKCPECTSILRLVVRHPRPNQKARARRAALSRCAKQISYEPRQGSVIVSLSHHQPQINVRKGFQGSAR